METEQLRIAVIELLTEEGYAVWKGQASTDIFALIPPWGTFLMVSLEPLPMRSLKRKERKNNPRANWIADLESMGAIVFYANDPKRILQILNARRFGLDFED